MKTGLLVLGLIILGSTVSLAQSGKVASEWKCEKASMSNSIPVADEANHAYAISQFKCTASKGEMAGAKEKEGTGTEFDDIKANNLTGHGIFVETLDSGDKIHISYQTTGAMKDGAMQSGSNRWHISDGSGKLKAAKGSGSCTGKGNADGSSTWTCTGSYSVPKSK
jgi:hypothetical protein